MSDRFKLFAAAVALVAMVFLPACYTLFNHPRLAELNYRRPEDRRCRTCHSASELWLFTHPAPRPERLGPWEAYYETPWWFERRWQSADSTLSPAGDG